MTTIAIITIVVVALLTLIIFALTWSAYNSCLKLYKIEVAQGKHDKEILAERVKKSHIGTVFAYIVLTLLAGLFVTGLVYKINGENISINNQTALVIKSGSMSDFYDDTIAQKYNYDKSLQFDVGDICIFEKAKEFTIGEVYGYKYKNIIITHRLVNVNDNYCEFRGDNNAFYDRKVLKECVVYHYTGNKVPSVGSVVLFAQSYFGLWTISTIVCMEVLNEVIQHKIRKIHKERSENVREMYVSL